MATIAEHCNMSLMGIWFPNSSLILLNHLKANFEVSFFGWSFIMSFGIIPWKLHFVNQKYKVIETGHHL